MPCPRTAVHDSGYVQDRPATPPASSLGGQLVLTLYILHVPAVLVPLAHGWMPETLLGVLSYAAAFYAAGIAGALWWRRRYPKGPFEGLLAAVTTAAAARTDGRLAG